MRYYLLLVLFFTLIIFPCKQYIKSQNSQDLSGIKEIIRPYARYWWFADEIKKSDVRYNLNWLKQQGFGGVELAWVYPLNAMDSIPDTDYTNRYSWLSLKWQDVVDYTIHYADSIGLGCDMTMGTLWPFGDSRVSYDQAARRYGVEERQKLTKSWEYPDSGYVVDHLNENHYLPYFSRMLDSFPQPETNITQSYFIDSWEVKTRKLWTTGFGQEFQQKYGYDIRPLMDSIYEEGFEHHLYDYMELTSDKVIEFYSDFDSTLNTHQFLSRGQCAGAPADIISAYAQLDIPEGESMLYEPAYNSIPASAAVLAGKNTVSAETFTCIYGWPAEYFREAQTADLKMVADALFANGVNRIIWHGKPHNPANHDSVNFYASVHVGPDSKMISQLNEFNTYLSTLAETMSKGKPYSNVAVYLPQEDAWMKGAMPKEKQYLWAWGWYEMRYLYFPEETEGYHPWWINKEFLKKAGCDGKVLDVGDAGFNHLVVDAQYLDFEVLKRINTIAETGFPMTLKQWPKEAGTQKHNEFKEIVSQLKMKKNLKTSFQPVVNPLVKGDNLPPFRARETKEGLIIFFANPNAKKLTFPIDYGQSYSEDTVNRLVQVYYQNDTINLNLQFKPNESLLYKIKDDKAQKIELEFSPKIPEIRSRPEDFKPRWKVK